MARTITNSDLYAATGAGTTVDSYENTPSVFGLQVDQVGGTATSWTIVLEGSMDGVTFTTIISHTNTDLTGTTKWTGGSYYPCLFYRTRCTAVALGTATGMRARFVGV